MLSAAELDEMTQTVNDSLEDVEALTILREHAGAADSWGHRARTNETEISVDGYVHEPRGAELAGPIVVGAVVATAEVRLPFGTQVNERDHIRRADDTLLEVVYVRDPSGYGLLLEAGVVSVIPVSAASSS